MNVLALTPAPNAVGRTELPDFAEIYRQHFSFVWRCLAGLGVRSSGLDDAAQDAFLVVHRRLHSFRGEASLRSWLYAIVRNVASNHRRSVRRRGNEVELNEEPQSLAPPPDVQLERREADAFVAAFLARIDDKKRDVFVLACIEQLGVPEVAETLGIPLNTAYTRLRSVRQEFQAAVARRGKP